MPGQAPGKKDRRTTSLNKPAACQLKVTLQGIEPPVWRRVLVPGRLTLDRLHLIIQRVMGWTDAHLHEFVIGRYRYGVPDPEMKVSNILPEQRVMLQDVTPVQDGRFIYLYDLGDGWEHEVVVEKLLPPVARRRYFVCLGGERHCPPENCGGPSGYAELLEAIHDRRHPQHDQMVEWVGGPFDPEYFDVDAVNRALKKIQ